MKLFSVARYGWMVLALALLATPGCIEGDDDDPDIATLRTYCTDQGGTLGYAVNGDGSMKEVCIYAKTVSFDEAEETLEFECGLEDFYYGMCEDGQGEDAAAEADPPVTVCPTCPKTVREMLSGQVEDIMLKIKNTGYTHRPFDLIPDYTELAGQSSDGDIDTYNLFTDCSGFVGYYVTQGIAPKLFEQLPRGYSCGPLTEEDGVTSEVARPLAADFYDYFKSATAYSEIVGESTDPDTACWGRVEHISDARPGDIIVYAHPENLDMDTEYCCKRDGSVYKTTKMEDGDTCDGGRIIHKAVKDKNGKTKNTGHVLFIHDYPYRSTEKKDGYGNYQWVVEVADSTTSPHMFDSRAIGADASVYGPNTYHAWTRGKGTVSRCEDGEYHRTCEETVVEITINTSGDDATGIGVGKIYVNDNMDGYRTNYSHATKSAEIVLGRPIVCQ